MTKKGQTIEGVVRVHYFSSHGYYSGKNYLLEPCSKTLWTIKEKNKSLKKVCH